MKTFLILSSIIIAIVFLVTKNTLINIYSTSDSKSLDKSKHNKAMFKILGVAFFHLLKYYLLSVLSAGLPSFIFMAIFEDVFDNPLHSYILVSFILTTLISFFWIFRFAYHCYCDNFAELENMNYRKFSGFMLVPILLSLAAFYICVYLEFSANSENDAGYFGVPFITSMLIFVFGFFVLRGCCAKDFVCKQCKKFASMPNGIKQSYSIENHQHNVRVRGGDVHVGNLKDEKGFVVVEVYKKEDDYYKKETYTEERSHKSIFCVCSKCGARWEKKISIWEFG